MNLHIPKAPNVIFLFGLSGSGKSYIGDLIGNKLGWHVYHADQDITKEMKECLKECRPFTDDIRQRYVDIIIPKIKELKLKHNHIVVTQGLYKNKHREIIAEEIQNLEFVWVYSNQETLMSRLTRRHQGVSIKTSIVLQSDFEPPHEGAKVIYNFTAGDEEIIRQLNRYYQ